MRAHFEMKGNKVCLFSYLAISLCVLHVVYVASVSSLLATRRRWHCWLRTSHRDACRVGNIHGIHSSRDENRSKGRNSIVINVAAQTVSCSLYIYICASLLKSASNSSSRTAYICSFMQLYPRLDTKYYLFNSWKIEADGVRELEAWAFQIWHIFHDCFKIEKLPVCGD
jgi:hypothetical protein